MSEAININQKASKSAKYQELFPQLKSLLHHEDDLIANLANITAALKETFDFFWIGFYMVKEDVLVLGPFQGPVACTRIAYGKGVCGTSWKERRTILVPDVNAFPGHIACNALSKSEIVLPIIKKNKVVAVLDIDSDRLNDFDKTDQDFLEKIVRLIDSKF